ncbi:MAG TPA: glutamine synthetase [Pseudonocardiaceae bacterium]|nr:glutamine synthetase [Pseudonocardiaceae bacterium]
MTVVNRGLGAVRPVGARSLAQRAEAALAILPAFRSAADSGRVDRVLLLLPDPHARFVAVELAADFVRDVVLERGYGACTYVLAWDVRREAIDAPALRDYLGGYGDFLLIPDLATLQPVAGRPATVAVVCDAAWPDGSPVELAARQVLRARLADAEARGLVPSVGIEHEVTFYDSAGAPLTGHGIDYALHTNPALDSVLAGIRRAIADSPLGVESARAECHPGQYEIVLAHRDALAACDDAMLLQHLVRTAAAEQGARASYLAAEGVGRGSSCHVHLSLSGVDIRQGFLAGVLRAARELSAVWAPTVNSYVRLRTAPFSPRVLRWGPDDRTAAVRVAGRGDSLRLEFRFAGADAQTHLVVAALLAAGLSGIEDELTPPEAGVAVGELAATPWEALRLLESSTLAERLLGRAVVGQQVALLESELAAACETVSDVQRVRGALRA